MKNKNTLHCSNDTSLKQHLVNAHILLSAEWEITAKRVPGCPNVDIMCASELIKIFWQIINQTV